MSTGWSPEVRVANRYPLLQARPIWGLGTLGLAIGVLVGAGLGRRDLVNEAGWPLLWQCLSAGFHPDLSPSFLSLVLHESLVTLAYAVCGTTLSLALGLVGGILASEVWWQSVWPQRSRRQALPWLTLRTLLAVPRAIHPAVWGIVWVNIIGLDPLSAILAIAIPFGAIVAKVFADILDNTPRHPWQALLASGVAPLPALLYGLLPLAGLNLLSYAFYRLECALRTAVVLGIVGAGGLGYQILLSLQSLRYEQLWTLFYALVALNGIVDALSATIRHRLGAPTRLDLRAPHRRSRQPAVPPAPGGDRWLAAAGLSILLLAPAAFVYLHPDWSLLGSPRTRTLAADLATQAWPPLTDVPLGTLVNLSLQTLAMSLLGICIAAVGGLLLSFPAAYTVMLPGGWLDPTGQGQVRQGWGWFCMVVARLALLVARAIPAPIWALALLFVFYPGMWPGALALGLHNLGIMGRLMTEVHENLDPRPLRALQALGLPGPMLFLYGLLPSTLPRFVAYALYRWEVAVRETAIVGLVGAGGLGRLLAEQLSSFDFRGSTVTLLCFVLLTLGVDLLSGTARRSLQ